jgi:hypothetical protein
MIYAQLGARLVAWLIDEGPFAGFLCRSQLNHHQRPDLSPSVRTPILPA